MMLKVVELKSLDVIKLYVDITNPVFSCPVTCYNVAYRVEYTDAFGRSRKCLRKDLPELEENDNHLMSKRERCLNEDYVCILALFISFSKVSYTGLNV